LIAQQLQQLLIEITLSHQSNQNSLIDAASAEAQIRDLLANDVARWFKKHFAVMTYCCQVAS